MFTFRSIPAVPAALTGCLLCLAAPGASALDVALTNDDGWDSPGIQAMKQALVDAGHTVTLAAPLDEQSGSSAAINTGTLKIQKEREDGTAMEFSVALAGGTEGAEPATSSLIAVGIARQRTGRLPDVLVSGINAGANIGAFTQLSGTVGSAIVALSSAFNGAVPAIAISTDEVCAADTVECEQANADHYARVAAFVVNVIAELERKPRALRSVDGLLPPGMGLNINYPPLEVPAGVVIARQGRTAAIGGATLRLNFGCYPPTNCAELGVGGYAFGGLSGAEPDSTMEVKDADSTSFNQGYVTIVPIEADYTSEPASRLNALLSLKSLRP